MTIVFYQNLSDNNVVNKNLHAIVTLPGFLRDNSSIINPVIDVEWTSEIINANYAYIPDFNRYYYIVDMSSVINGIWTISMHVDVLFTYRSEIKNQNAVIARQENIYNLYLEDDKLLTTSRRIYWTKAFPTRMNAAGDGSSFVLTLAGGQKSSS